MMIVIIYDKCFHKFWFYLYFISLSILFQVTEAGKRKLPKWLRLDTVSHCIEGVAEIDQVGSTFYLEVTTTESRYTNSSSTWKDLFTIRVVDEDQLMSFTVEPGNQDDTSGEMTDIKCPRPSAATTITTIIIDADMETMTSSKRTQLIRSVGTFLELSFSSLKLVPLPSTNGFSDEDDQHFPSKAALVAGPGDVKRPRHQGVMIQWIVGCGNVIGRHMDVLQKLETTSQNGDLAAAIKHGVIGWHVINKKSRDSSLRPKRLVSVRATATMIPIVGLPTGRPTATVFLTQTDAPKPRIVPTLASFVPAVQPTQTHPQKSRTKTRTHHQHKTKHHKMMVEPTSVLSRDNQASSSYPQGWTQATSVDLHHKMSTIVDLEPSVVMETAGYSGPTTSLPNSEDFITEVHDTLLTPTRPVTKESGRQDGPTPGLLDEFNFPPMQKNDIDQINVFVGEVFRYKLANDTFVDYEEGSTTNLKVIFLTVDGLTMAPNSWIKYDEKTQSLYGIPLEEHVGRQEYVLSAIDRGGKLARDTFEILVTRNPGDRTANHEFSVWLDLDYQRFISDVDMRYDVAGKIAHAFGSQNSREMAILRIGYGSVEFVWTNKTLSTQLPCPVDNLERLAMLMIFPNGTYNQEFSERVIPYRVTRVEFEPKFSCASAMTAKNAKPMITYREEDGTSGTAISVLINDRPKSATDADERLLSTVVMPSLIVFAVLLLILPTVCFVYRRNSKNRTAGNLDNRSVKQGAPVIFANELEERADFNAAAKPLIMTEEKQPVPPPFYDPAATANNSPLNARSSCRELLVSSEQDVDRHGHLRLLMTGRSHDANAALQTKFRGFTSRRNPPPYMTPHSAKIWHKSCKLSI